MYERVCAAMACAVTIGSVIGCCAPLNAEEIVTTAVDKDTYIDSSPGYDCNHGAMTSSLKAVLNGPADGTKTRILLQLPTASWTVPPLTKLESLKLYMYCTQSVSAGFTARLYPLTHGFVEGTGTTKNGSNKTGATWGTYDGTNPWGTAGGDFDSSNYVDAARASNGAAISADAWACWDLTSLADDAGLQAYGAMIAVAPEDANLLTGGWETKAFNSSDFATVSLRPYVEMTYTAVPEPSSAVVFLTLVAGIAGRSRFSRKRSRVN